MFDHRMTITVTPVVGKDVIGHATDIWGDVAHQLASLQDRVVREQLIAAGWTPPEVRKQDEALIRQLVEALENHQGNYKLTKNESVPVNVALEAARARLHPTPPEGSETP